MPRIENTEIILTYKETMDLFKPLVDIVEEYIIKIQNDNKQPSKIIIPGMQGATIYGVEMEFTKGIRYWEGAR